MARYIEQRIEALENHLKAQQEIVSTLFQITYNLLSRGRDQTRAELADLRKKMKGDRLKRRKPVKRNHNPKRMSG